MGRGEGRRWRGWGGGCGCEYFDLRGVVVLGGFIAWGRGERERLMVVWVVGSSWLMMLLIRGVSAVWGGSGGGADVGCTG